MPLTGVAVHWLAELPHWTWWLETLASPAATVFAVWLGVRVVRRRFIRERTWEQRRLAYSQIVAALSDALRTLEYMSHMYDLDAQAFDISDDGREANERYHAAYDAARRAFNDNVLLFPKPVEVAFSTMQVQLAQIDDLDPPETNAEVILVISRALTEIASLARKDLDIPERT